MKKLLRIGILCGVLTLLLCVGALAAGEKGIYGISSESGFTIAAVGATKTEAYTINEQSETLAFDAVKVSVTYTDASVLTTNQYFLVVTDTAIAGNVIPTATNIQYVQQDAPASNGSVTFSTVYPKSLTSGKTYYIYLSHTGGGSLTAAGTFKYYSARDLGDVNGKNGITSADASKVLQYAAGLTDLTGDDLWAADVNKKNGVTSADASKILQFAAGIIDSF